ncbi:MAG: sel1 repeat family protein [Sulfurovum sp.]|nr:hypothetical protein [Sulfurovum sp.]NNJ45229.1 sel1 repeat family protein [Sulfurovum sp.]
MKKIIMSILILTMGVYATVIEETRRSCEAGDAKDCKTMGDVTRAGLGVEQDYAKAHYYYDKSCFDGNKDACKELAAMDKK